jgi:hypothetical protein
MQPFEGSSIVGLYSLARQGSICTAKVENVCRARPALAIPAVHRVLTSLSAKPRSQQICRERPGGQLA